ncbi:MAG: hypothetical protein AAF916_05205 [Planctomycetota bacterium]
MKLRNTMLLGCLVGLLGASLVGCRAPEATTQVRHGGVTYVFDRGMYMAQSRGPSEIVFVGPQASADFTSRNGRLVRNGEVVGEVEPGDAVRIRPDGTLLVEPKPDASVP